jgi:hypothetical protein
MTSWMGAVLPLGPGLPIMNKVDMVGRTPSDRPSVPKSGDTTGDKAQQTGKERKRMETTGLRDFLEIPYGELEE